MSTQTKNIVRSYLKPYLKKLNPTMKISDNDIFKCPFNCSDKDSANIINNSIQCYTSGCKGGDIYALLRNKSSMASWSDEDIEEYLIHLFKIEVHNNIDELLTRYEEAKFYLFPLAAGTKIPIKDFKWKEDCVCSKSVWESWLNRGYGLGKVSGKKSGTIDIDIDSKETYEKVKHLLNDTLTQNTKRGNHYIYDYDSDFDNVNHDNLRDKGYEMEVRANNAYIVVAPTSVEGELRKWNDKKIVKMNPELKAFLLDNINKKEANKDEDQKIQDAINIGKIDNIDLSGRRNDTFVKLAGIFRKKLNEQQTEYILNIISNTLIDKPLPQKELKAIMGQVKKYQCYDKSELAKQVLNRLEIVGEGSAFTLSKSLSIEQKDIEDVLHYLNQEGKIIDIGKNRYKINQEIEWETGFNDFSVPLKFEVPYFSKYAYLDEGNMIIIGAVTGTGKTTLAANIIKKFYDKQEIKSIDLITTEAGSKIGKVLDLLKVDPGFVYSPKKIFDDVMQMKMRKNSVTIIDWITPKDGDFAKTINNFKHLHDQLRINKGLLICFVQMRQGYFATNGKWVEPEFFAKDQLSQYAALTMKFLYPDGKDNLNPYGQTTKIRDSKNGHQYLKLPFKFDPKTKVLDAV